jgi:hypothetical protein
VRFKDDIKPMGETSEAIVTLKPVTFRHKKELNPQDAPQFGLVAEEVANVNPDLVKRHRDGKLPVRYEAVNAMLLNEFLKAHRKVEGLEAAGITAFGFDNSRKLNCVS